MVEVGIAVGIGNLILASVLIWRILLVESTIHDRVDEIDRSLGGVVGMIVDRIDTIASNVPDINLINQNPIGQIIDFLKGNSPNADLIHSQPPPKGPDGQFIEVEELKEHAPTKEKENAT